MVVHRPRRASWSSSACRQQQRQQQTGSIPLPPALASAAAHPLWMLVSPLEQPPQRECASMRKLVLLIGCHIIITLLNGSSGGFDENDMHKRERTSSEPYSQLYPTDLSQSDAKFCRLLNLSGCTASTSVVFCSFSTSDEMSRLESERRHICTSAHQHISIEMYPPRIACQSGPIVSQ